MTYKTKDIITMAFLELVQERPVEKITVKDIVERCDVNRNTFYYHFRDIPDVVEYIISQIVNELMEDKEENATFSDFFMNFLLYLDAHKKSALHIYKSLKRESFIKYMRLLFSYMADPLRETASELDALSEEEKEIVLFFCICVMEGIILEWFESDMDEEVLNKARTASQFFNSDRAQILALLNQRQKLIDK